MPAPTRHFLSVGTKLTIVMLVVLGIVTSITYFQVSRNEREQLLSAKERSAKMVTELFAAGVTAPLSFNDDPGVREHVALLTASSNVRYAAVWDVSESNHAERGTKVDEVIKEGSEAAASQKRELPKAIEVERTDDLLTVEQPVTSAAGETLGVVRVSFSLDRELAAIAKAKQRTLITSIVMAIALAGVLLALTRTLIVKRLAVLSLAAKRFEEQGSSEELRSADDLAKCSLCSYVAFAVPTVKNTNDEVGALAHALSSMAETIATREARIFERNQDLRHILDNVAEGLMTVKKDGTMSHERSRSPRRLVRRSGRPAQVLRVLRGVRAGDGTLASDRMDGASRRLHARRGDLRSDAASLRAPRALLRAWLLADLGGARSRSGAR